MPELSLAAAIALGAVISPTDAVAATSVGKKLGLPGRLVTVLEGEGLVNDASALVLLRSAIAATAGAISLWGAVLDFGYAVAVGTAIGLVVGALAVVIRARLSDPVLATAISFAVPFIAYLPAEELGSSGVLAVVAAGLVTGHKSARHFTAQDRLSERMNWRTLQFVLENGVFLLMGYEVRTLIGDVRENNLGVGSAVTIGLLVTVVLIVIRILFTTPLIMILRGEARRAEDGLLRIAEARERIGQFTPNNERERRRLSRFTQMVNRRASDANFMINEGLGWRGGAVISWSGMRGVVTVAAAQSLPSDVPYRSQLILIAFTVAVVTLLLQGGTLPLLIRLLGVHGRGEDEERAELALLLGEISAVAAETLKNPELRQQDGSPFDPEVLAEMVQGSRDHVEEVNQAVVRTDTGRSAQIRALRRILLNAKRAALLDARSAGDYSSEVIIKAQLMLDLAETRDLYH